MGDGGLSQDDFRKLLATPRAPPSGEEASPFKMPPAKTPRNTGAVFAKPRHVKKKRPDSNRKSSEDKSTNETLHYRDRAAERRAAEDDPEAPLSTEEILLKTTVEKGDTLDAQQVYEQSKYLGGDVSHTHLVKGLDFALLQKVRTEITQKKQEISERKADLEAEDELEAVMDKINRGERIAAGTSDDEMETEETNEPVFHSIVARNIFNLVHSTPPAKNETLTPGRMAFVFELADEVGHYSDAFAIPTAVIRSKADVALLHKKMGWSEDLQAESELVISKISQVMTRLRTEERLPKLPGQKTVKVEGKGKEPTHVTIPDHLMDIDIFAGAGRDYTLDEASVEQKKKTQSPSDVNEESKPTNYFSGISDETPLDASQDVKQDDEIMKETKQEVAALLKRANAESSAEAADTSATLSRKRGYDQVPEDADANDIDMFGLSTSALPTSFEERKRTVVYDGESDEEKNTHSSLVDQGTHRNKKAQLTRWDF
ncbi:RED-like protein N-terminal region-domain-containing protein, partial [Radiomyces spectabilis]|uniref:RED-like protein N-terminal region-domain-containing protein n=1 Tax=Radiomyces spectabilis TaxID=64574 RepID=UPI00221F3957